MKYFIIMWWNNIVPNIKRLPTRYKVNNMAYGLLKSRFVDYIQL